MQPPIGKPREHKWTWEPGRSLTCVQPGAMLCDWQAHLCFEVDGKCLTEPVPFVRPGSDQLSDSRLGARLLAADPADGPFAIAGLVENKASVAIRLRHLELVIGDALVGASGGRLSFFKNGYQSWTETRSFRAGETQRVPFPPAMVVLQDNPSNLPSHAGEYTSDMFAVLGNLDSGAYLLLGQGPSSHQMLSIQFQFPQAVQKPARLTLRWDFGGQEVAPGGQVSLDDVYFLLDVSASVVQDTYFGLVRRDSASRHDLPTGWCSWYYYYTRVSEPMLRRELATIRQRQVRWQYFVLDDGYETAVGDWLSVNAKFPSGLAALASEVRGSGLAPGLWLAPFIARRNSRLYREHPEWVLRDERGRPLVAGWNPNWGIDGLFYGLDTTHPAFQDQLRRWVRTMVHEWGFQYLKLDFAYGACLPAVACDRSLSPAERLSLGYQLIRETAGPRVFLLGCGSPLAPARGWVDAMRIGPDVAPYWFAKYRYHLTRDPHAVCTQFAIRNILNRCAMHRRLWINDPDCLLLRDRDTKLTADERRSLANVVAITGGMMVLSDQLDALPESAWATVELVERLARECDRGTTWALDQMEREMPELVYNSSGYLAVFNWKGQGVHKEVRLGDYLPAWKGHALLWEDAWTGETIQAPGGELDLGSLRRHSSRLLRMIQPDPNGFG